MNKIFLILMMFILGSALIFAGCKQQEEAAATTPPITQPEAQPPAEEPGMPPGLPFEQEAGAEEEAAAEEAAAPEQVSGQLLSNVRCVNKNIDAVVTNIGDKQVDLAEAKIFVNGILSRVEMSCDKTVLNAGESSQCTGINGRISLSAEKANKIIFRVDFLQQEELVECK